MCVLVLCNAAVCNSPLLPSSSLFFSPSYRLQLVTVSFLTFRFRTSRSVDRLFVNDNRLRYADVSRLASADRKPLDGVLVVERPWRDGGDEGDGGAAECNVNGELDVLQDIANNKGDDLYTVCSISILINAAKWPEGGGGRGKGHLRQQCRGGQSSTYRRVSDPQSPMQKVSHEIPFDL